MRGDYTALIEKVSMEIAECLLGQEEEGELVQEVSILDGQILLLLRQIGLRVMGLIFEALQQRLMTQGQATGSTLHRWSQITYSVIFGVLSLSSAYLWKRGSGQRPLRELGLRHQGRSLTVEKALASFGSEESFAQAAERFREHYGWSVDKSTVWRVTERVAQEAEQYPDQRLEKSPAVRAEEELLLELDGCDLRTGILVPRTDTAKGAKPKKQRITQWREVRTGLVRPLGAVSKQYVGGMLDYPTVVGQLRAAALQQGMTAQTQMVAVADGGQGLKEELETQFHPLQFILDRPHLKSHLHETAHALDLEPTAQLQWVQQQMTTIDQGAVAAVIEELQQAECTQPVERRERLRGYLERFQDCVHYDAFREKGWPIGSGEVESSHRSIPQKRLKLPGAWWHPDSVNPMMALRVLRANGWWEEFWQKKEKQAA